MVDQLASWVEACMPARCIQIGRTELGDVFTLTFEPDTLINVYREPGEPGRIAFFSSPGIAGHEARPRDADASTVIVDFGRWLRSSSIDPLDGTVLLRRAADADTLDSEGFRQHLAQFVKTHRTWALALV